MKQTIFSLQSLVFVAFMCFSCQVSTSSTQETATASDSLITESTTQNTTSETDQAKEVESTTAVYRSDGYRPNMVSEWISVKTNIETFEILEMWYWNVQDEKKVKLTILSQEYKEGEEVSGHVGKMKFPNLSEEVGFGMIEDQLNITWSENEGQEFILDEESLN